MENRFYSFLTIGSECQWAVDSVIPFVSSFEGRQQDNDPSVSGMVMRMQDIRLPGHVVGLNARAGQECLSPVISAEQRTDPNQATSAVPPAIPSVVAPRWSVQGHVPAQSSSGPFNRNCKWERPRVGKFGFCFIHDDVGVDDGRR